MNNPKFSIGEIVLIKTMDQGWPINHIGKIARIFLYTDDSKNEWTYFIESLNDECFEEQFIEKLNETI